MKKQLNQLRRFFARTGARKLNAATARDVIPASYDDDDSSNRLSGAFIVVLVLHVIALVGVFAFSRMKDPKAHGSGNSSNAQSALAGNPVENRSETPVSAPTVRNGPSGAASAQYVSLQAAKYSTVADPEITGTPERSASDLLRSPPPGSSRPPYVVKNGDNLTKIAIAFNVRAAELKSANSLKTDDIKPGQELVIPDPKVTRSVSEPKVAKAAERPASAKTTPATHKVRKNETLAKIARDLGVSYDDLSKLNGIKDPRKLQEGQILKVPRKS